MNTSRLTRRGILVGAAAIVAARISPARAQVAVDEGCTVSFVNGLAQLNPECQLTPVGLGMSVSPPSQLVSLTQAVDSTTSTTATPPQHGGRRQRAAQRHRLQKQRRLANQRRQRKRHGGGHGGTTTPTV